MIKPRSGTISSSAQHYSDWKDAHPYTDADIRAMAVPSSIPVGGSAVMLYDVPSPAYLAQAQQVAGNAHNIKRKSPHSNACWMFDRANFLDLIQNFTIFKPVDGRRHQEGGALPANTAR